MRGYPTISVEEKELKVLNLEDMTNLIWIIFTPLLIMILIFSYIQYGFFFWYEYFWFAAIAVFIGVPFLCIILGTLVLILSELEFVKTDGNWSTLDLIKSFYSELYPEYFNNKK